LVSKLRLKGMEFASRWQRMYQFLAVLFLLMWLGACATSQEVIPSQTPATVEDRAVVDGEVLPLPSEPSISVESLPPSQTVSPVVKRLLASADQQSRSGDADAAANSLERALRIEPRNAVLWSRLADIRFSQGDWQQAVQLAAKSNTLAADDRGLRRQNWYLMATAYDEMGDDQAAQKFRDKLIATP
jgi:tetratricopeptide (TPR) repeat protein